MQKAFILIFVFLFGCSAYSQESITNVIDSLRSTYSLYPGVYPNESEGDSIPPPPPLISIENAAPKYVEAYCIPSEVIKEYYPWNADSIYISFGLETKSKNNFKLEEQDISALTDILYKYDYNHIDHSEFISLTTIVGSGSPIANFRLTFYHKDESFFADFYKHIDNCMRIIDSSYNKNPYLSITDPYLIDEDYSSLVDWGKHFDISFRQISEYIMQRFGENVSIGLYENDIEQEDLLFNLDELEEQVPSL